MSHNGDEVWRTAFATVFAILAVDTRKTNGGWAPDEEECIKITEEAERVADEARWRFERIKPVQKT